MALGQFYDVLREGLRVAFVISLPILLVGLSVGLLVGLLQALTSIQEMTLTFVPKLAAIVAIYWVTVGFMTETLVNFFQTVLIPGIIGL